MQINTKEDFLMADNTAIMAGRLINFPIKLSKRMKTNQVCTLALDEAMAITNCDGGTFYLPHRDGLAFQYMVTKSKNWKLNSSDGTRMPWPVPMRKEYVCAYVAMSQKPINIMDVYNATEYDFKGTYKYDRENQYRTKSMLVVPLSTESSGLMGILQLINSMDEEGNTIPFMTKHVQYIQSLGAMTALKLDNISLRAEDAMDEGPINMKNQYI